ncbi:type IV toxin-antitoxin system AbiEi family antitoxin domain-containing protein [Modestobacter sp. VKM Ac-2978]|uniref:type IV toxin-antitoxin system AbiEi family antitoxin domain-containing protein n=1 Tax=Modestobacter sp. VKM Ac-2978 TaxID=3004132 RepID=UPI0022AAB337|nr:hypothetical protein [Modestobacter sp. VKM Ac-2978]MCZ2847030.1 hypothetical protein [Modestobacter sp. VKM Ac-2978]
MTDPLPSGVLLRASAVRQGFDDGELARLVRSEQLDRLQRGAYIDPHADPAARARAVIIATVAGLRLPGAVSHGSAAVLHGLPTWRVGSARVHVTRTPPASGASSRRVHLHVARLDAEETTVVDGVLTTDVTRTVVDLARTLTFESAVVTADAALAFGSTTAAQLRVVLQRMGSVPGTRRAARVIAFADARSESVGESRSRVLLARSGLTPPELQVEVRRRDGSLVGRSDFGWVASRTLGEFDGRIKYGRLLRPGESAGDAVYREKLREDEMRDLGWEVARWTWPEIDEAGVVAARLRRAFTRGNRR